MADLRFTPQNRQTLARIYLDSADVTHLLLQQDVVQSFNDNQLTSIIEVLQQEATYRKDKQ